MSRLGFYEKYVMLMGNLRDKPDRATPYKIEYLRKTIKNGKVYKFISFDGEANLVRTKIDTLMHGKSYSKVNMILSTNFNDINIPCAESDILSTQRCLSFRWIKLRKPHKARKYGILGTT